MGGGWQGPKLGPDRVCRRGILALSEVHHEIEAVGARRMARSYKRSDRRRGYGCSRRAFGISGRDASHNRPRCCDPSLLSEWPLRVKSGDVSASAKGKSLRRRNPKTGERRSLRAIAAKLASLGHVNLYGRPRGREHQGHVSAVTLHGKRAEQETV